MTEKRFEVWEQEPTKETTKSEVKMTEKRFTIHESMVCDRDMEIPITLWQNKEQQRNFCDTLNNLHEENEQLKQRNNFLKKQLDRVCSENEIMGDKLKKIGRML